MVPTDVLEELLKISAQAPSTRNFQPWKVNIVTGAVLEKIKRSNVAQLFAGVAPHAEVLIENQHESREPAFRQRQISVAKQLFKSMDIQRDDTQRRTEWLLRGFRFFDAPVALILSSSDALTKPVMAFDIALFSQTLCLAAMNFDLGTCIAQQGVSYPEVIRHYTEMPESERIIIGISIGYPDRNFAANDVITNREPVERFSRWYGFGEKQSQ